MNLKSKFFKFIGAGAINTVVSYLVYAFLVLFLNYQLSYAIAFAFGIILSFALNTKYVFEIKQTMKKFVLFPLVYVVQYLLGAFMMNFIIETVDINKLIAPFIIVVILLPVNYIFTKKVLMS